MRNTIIATVGTSLFQPNLEKLSEKIENKPSNWEEIKEYYDQKNWKGLAKELLFVDPNERICGAEINTIEKIRIKKNIQLENIIFLVSDTEDGNSLGKTLKHYFENRKDLGLKNVVYEEVEFLQAVNSKDFKTKGLRNLVSIIGRHVKLKGKENVVIDATGGYKAQIAIAFTIGQVLSIPVYYKHEIFNETIDFPPLPISLDYDILGKNAEMFWDLRRDGICSGRQLEELDDKLKIFLDEIEEGNETLYSLNFMGELYLVAFDTRYEKSPSLKVLNDSQRKNPSFGDDHHLPNGFKHFVEKVWKENKWIKTCFSINYNQQKSIKGIGFFVKEEGGNKYSLVGTYAGEGNPSKARFKIQLSDNSIESLTWAATQLNMQYR